MLHRVMGKHGEMKTEKKEGRAGSVHPAKKKNSVPHKKKGFWAALTSDEKEVRERLFSGKEKGEQ